MQKNVRKKNFRNKTFSPGTPFQNKNVFTWNYLQYHLKLKLLRPCVGYSGKHCKEFPKKNIESKLQENNLNKIAKKFPQKKCFHRELFTVSPSHKTPLCAAV